MKRFFILVFTTLLGFPYCGHAKLAPLALKDIPYSFDSDKIESTKNISDFFRNFADYYFLLIQKNKPLLKSYAQNENLTGWCVGDAHPENFGFLIQRDGASLFTFNDMDDAGPCPLMADVLRFMTSSVLYSKKVNISGLWYSYLQGLQSLPIPSPYFLTELRKKSIRGGIAPNPKKLDGHKFERDDFSAELSHSEISQLQELLSITLKEALPLSAQFVDAIRTSKLGGGSSGLTRYEVLYDLGEDKLLHLELKEQLRPAVYPIATFSIPSTAERIAQTIRIEQGTQASPYYQTIYIFGKDMLIRPRFGGNKGIALDKQSEFENLETIAYEAYVLGQIHSNSISKIVIEQMKHVSLEDLTFDTNLMLQQFQWKYSQLK